jgi:hypothetical protein
VCQCPEGQYLHHGEGDEEPYCKCIDEYAEVFGNSCKCKYNLEYKYGKCQVRAKHPGQAPPS